MSILIEQLHSSTRQNLPSVSLCGSSSAASTQLQQCRLNWLLSDSVVSHNWHSMIVCIQALLQIPTTTLVHDEVEQEALNSAAEEESSTCRWRSMHYFSFRTYGSELECNGYVNGYYFLTSAYAHQITYLVLILTSVNTFKCSVFAETTSNCNCTTQKCRWHSSNPQECRSHWYARSNIEPRSGHCK